MSCRRLRHIIKLAFALAFGEAVFTVRNVDLGTLRTLALAIGSWENEDAMVTVRGPDAGPCSGGVLSVGVHLTPLGKGMCVF